MTTLAIIWAFITGQEVVYLRDSDGDVTLTFAYFDPFGTLKAKRYWPWNLRNVELGADGKVINGSYVKEWIYLKDGK